MANEAANALVEASFRLSRVSPSVWADFMVAYRAYAAHQVETSIQAPVAEVSIAHGRGQAYCALRDFFRDVDLMYKKLHP